MKRTLDIVQAQIAILSELQREIEHVTGRVSTSTAHPYEKGTADRRIETYVATRLSDLRFEERQMRNRANVHA